MVCHCINTLSPSSHNPQLPLLASFSLTPLCHTYLVKVPFEQTCMAARMEYVQRNKDCARQRVDALQHYEVSV
jgi:hypothetical protein